MGMFISEALDQIETLDVESSWHFIETIKMQGKQNKITEEIYENNWQDSETLSLIGGDFDDIFPLTRRGHDVHREIEEFEEICLSFVQSGLWQIARNLILVFGNGIHENGWDWEAWNLDTIMQFIAAECVIDSGLGNFDFWLDSKVQFVGTEQLYSQEGLQLFGNSFISRSSGIVEAFKTIDSQKAATVDGKTDDSSLVGNVSTFDLDFESVIAFSLSLICRAEDDFIRECSESLNSNPDAFQDLEFIHWKLSEFLETGDKHELDVPELLITYSLNGPGKLTEGHVRRSVYRDSLINKLKSLDDLLEKRRANS